MKNKTIIITGISGGIGHFAALRMLEKSNTVIGVGRTSNSALEANANFEFYQCDFENLEIVEKVFGNIAENWDIDCVLNTSMYMPPHRPFLQYSSDDMERSFRVCTVAPFIIVKKLAPKMRKNRFGRILFLGSVVQLTGSRGQFPYLVSKSSLEGLIKGLALELERKNVSVSMLLLGPVETEHYRSNISESSQKINESRMSERRVMTMDEVYPFIELALSEEGISANGSLIPVTQGYHLG